MYYAGTVWFRMTEETFWRTTPRKLFAMIRVHLDLMKAQHGGGEESPKKQKSSGTPISYIDQLNW